MEKYGEKQYQIDRPEDDQLSLKARQIAGLQIQDQFRIHNKVGELKSCFDGLKWLKSENTFPAFDTFSFAYKSSIFSVVVEIAGDKVTSFNDSSKKILLDACNKYKLVPCLFRIRMKEAKPALVNLFKSSANRQAVCLKPFEKGWNLVDARTNVKILPHLVADESLVTMSDWELLNFAVQVVVNDLERNGNIILSFCDLPEINPQIWFKDGKGNICWVIVRHVTNKEELDYKQWTGLEKSTPQLLPYDGFFASVRVFSSNNNSETALHRGDGMFISYKGIERIYVA